MALPAAPSAHRPLALIAEERRRALTGAAFAAPATLLLLLIHVVPIVVLFSLSATDYELGAIVTRAVGLANYERAFADPAFRRSLANTLLYVSIVLPASVLGGLLVALLVHARRRTRSLYEVIYFLPVTSTLIAMATVWQFVLHPTLGPIAAVLRAFDRATPSFLTEPDLVLPTLAFIGIWQLVGFNMVLFLAGLSAIPRDLYEAAALDGAEGAIDRFLRVTWPMLGPTTMFVTVTSAITAFKVFDTVAVLTQGGPMGASSVVLYAIYLEAFQYFHLGYAAALTVVFLAFVIVFALAQAFAFDRRVHYA
ncbi:MAG: sugar ABC transporter permease [Acetobacteraceae bacterium]|nr:sugar ABC transporter permease [Acetobacteraceae bacterium]